MQISEDLLRALEDVELRAGPQGWSYLDPDGEAPTVAAPGPDPLWTDTAPQPLWTVPRHMPICSFGTFNPAGPTVSSLEAAMSTTSGAEPTYSLYFVMRHPHVPEIRWLGDAADYNGLAQLVSDALAETDTDHGICGAIEWLDIFQMKDVVLDGIRQFASAQDGSYCLEEGEALNKYAFNPWARISRGSGSANRSESAVHIPAGEEPDPLDVWVEAITDPAVIAGHQLFMRSAWEGAKLFRTGDFDGAQEISNSIQRSAYERLDAEIAYHQD